MSIRRGVSIFAVACVVLGCDVQSEGPVNADAGLLSVPDTRDSVTDDPVDVSATDDPADVVDVIGELPVPPAVEQCPEDGCFTPNVCLDGECLQPAEVEGTECARALDCALDFVCVNGRCVTKLCAGLCQWDGTTCALPGLDQRFPRRFCTQQFGCNWDWAAGCVDGRPYCVDDEGQEVNATQCPDVNERFWDQ